MTTNLRAQTITRPTNDLATSDDPWWSRAACFGQSPSEWDTCSREAKRVCFMDCKVRAECLADALEYESRPGVERTGMRGGLDPDQRSARVKAARRA